MSSFSKSDYESNDGMLTYIWGPPLWHVLHTISFNYPVNPTDEDKMKYECFILSMGFILPCRHCRENFYKNIKSINFSDKDFENREAFSKMIFNLHEEVNKQLGKPSSFTYENVRDRYENFRSRCNLKNAKEIKQKTEKGCTEHTGNGVKMKCDLHFKAYDPDCPKNTSIKFDKSCKMKKD